MTATTLRVPASILREATLAALQAAGADERSARDATRAMMHASLYGVDSHGVRLTPHYAKVLQTGRVNPKPVFRIERKATSAALLHADDGLGHPAAYAAMDLACDIGAEHGIGAVGVVQSSHFGAAGAYALAAAERGFVALASTNSNPGVALHDGAAAFHGTNPIAFAAPVKDARPWFLDMATSSIPFNRVYLYQTLGLPLPPDVAADARGETTEDPAAADMLIPLGGTSYGFKGAALAGMVTILCGILTGAVPDPAMLQMTDTDDWSTPRNVGHFCLAIDPERFVGRAAFDALMASYLGALHGAPARAGQTVMAPGEREWAVAAERERNGIPIDRATAAFFKLA